MNSKLKCKTLRCGNLKHFWRQRKLAQKNDVIRYHNQLEASINFTILVNYNVYWPLIGQLYFMSSFFEGKFCAVSHFCYRYGFCSFNFINSDHLWFFELRFLHVVILVPKIKNKINVFFICLAAKI